MCVKGGVDARTVRTTSVTAALMLPVSSPAAGLMLKATITGPACRKPAGCAPGRARRCYSRARRPPTRMSCSTLLSSGVDTRHHVNQH
jgi:hypothetical protein